MKTTGQFTITTEQLEKIVNQVLKLGESSGLDPIQFLFCLQETVTHLKNTTGAEIEATELLPLKPIQVVN